MTDADASAEDGQATKQPEEDASHILFTDSDEFASPTELASALYNHIDHEWSARTWYGKIRYLGVIAAFTPHWVIIIVVVAIPAWVVAVLKALYRRAVDRQPPVYKQGGCDE